MRGFRFGSGGGGFSEGDHRRAPDGRFAPNGGRRQPRPEALASLRAQADLSATGARPTGRSLGPDPRVVRLAEAGFGPAAVAEILNPEAGQHRGPGPDPRVVRLAEAGFGPAAVAEILNPEPAGRSAGGSMAAGAGRARAAAPAGRAPGRPSGWSRLRSRLREMRQPPADIPPWSGYEP